MTCQFGLSTTVWGYVAFLVSLVADVSGVVFAICAASRSFSTLFPSTAFHDRVARRIGLFITTTLILICSVVLLFVGYTAIFYGIGACPE
ncbi:MAG TPA: hypothetical protein VFU78_11155 [Thermomicrobiales bacterium]|nr:hypothetical protein [Thermomicrobiales bacterium]